MREGQGPDARASAANEAEAQLLARILAGDRCAFEALYRAYFPRLNRFLHRFTHSSPLIEEIINDTMLVVWQKAGSYDGSSRVSTWIFAIAYHKALQGFRARDEPVESDMELCPGSLELEPEQQLLQRQLRCAIAAAIQQLPLRLRRVVLLSYYHDMGYNEIAAAVDCPLNTVKTHVFHARRQLQHLLACLREQGE